MSLFKYSAFDARGSKVSGVINADSLAAARKRLAKEDLAITSLVIQDNIPDKLTSSTLIDFTRDMWHLSCGGVPIYDAMLSIVDKHNSSKALMFLDICDRIKMGSTLHGALEAYPKTFSEIYIAMVAAGEQGGNMAHVFKELYDVLAKKEATKKKLYSLMAYPLFLFFFAGLIMVWLLLFLLPSMEDILGDRQLEGVTWVVFSISRWTRKHIFGIVTTFCTLVAGGAAWWWCRWGAKKISCWFLKVPIFGKIIMESALSRFFKALSALLSSGIPLIEALGLAKKVLSNEPLEELIKCSEQAITQGEKLSVALHSPYISPIIGRVLATAEETGELCEAIERIANMYDETLTKSALTFVSLIQPIILCVVGALIGLVMLSVLLPLSDISGLM